MDEGAEARYRAALDLYTYEGHLLWQVYGVFVTANAIFLGFLAQLLRNTEMVAAILPPWLAVVPGVVLCIIWFATHSRISSYFDFRLAQAREAEPKEWTLLRGIAERFARGSIVHLGERHYQIALAGRWSARTASRLLIVVFFISYVVLGVALAR